MKRCLSYLLLYFNRAKLPRMITRQEEQNYVYRMYRGVCVCVCVCAHVRVHVCAEGYKKDKT